jgi:aspartate carbamoyltransferase catalytic subunit
VKLYFIAPPGLQIKPDILSYLDHHRIEYELGESLEKILPKVDVVYRTHIDRERLQRRDIDLSIYNINVDALKRMKSNAIIMHPLPRSVEIDPAVDNDPRAVYFSESRNGLFVRMALLTLLFENE